MSSVYKSIDGIYFENIGYIGQIVSGQSSEGILSVYRGGERTITVSFNGDVHKVEYAVVFYVRGKLYTGVLAIKVVSEFRYMAGIFENYKGIIDVSSVKYRLEFSGAFL